MKALDFFRKPKMEYEKETICGSILSLLTFLVASVLIWYQIVDWLQVLPETKVAIQGRGVALSPQMDVSIDILFDRAPCASLRVLKEDLTETQSTIIRSGLVFERLPKNSNERIPANHIAPELHSAHPGEEERVLFILTGLRDRERCRVRGTFSVRRVPGSFFVNHELYESVLVRVRQLDPTLYERINLSHILLSLVFGSSKLKQNIESFAPNMPYTELNRAGGMAFMHSQSLRCTYYLKVIPYTYIVTGFSAEEQEATEVFQYSQHRECYVRLKSLS